MTSEAKSAYRINYRTMEHPNGRYYIAAENAFNAKMEFLTRTQYPRESITSIEVNVGREWRKVQGSDFVSEPKKCDHEQDEMCGCITGMSTASRLIFIAGNIRDVSWELDYATLAEPGDIRLCIVGTCGKCGDRLCYGAFIGNEATGEELIESIYTYLALAHKLDGLQMDAPKSVQMWLDRRNTT